MKSRSLAGRAVLALVLMIGFYCLALAVAGFLFLVPYLEWTLADRLHVKLALLCIVLGGIVLWSALPRIDRFAAPGPRLSREQQPRLFGEIEKIARATGQAMPAEVYLVGDVNAWVAQRGGLMGFGSRRVMGLGLPLLATLTRSQLCAVLAHEFGHFHGGDTRLGPLIYRTRSAIERTVLSLSDQDGAGTLVQLPFRWYGNMFLRVTHAVSRHQELCADALAARTVGARHLIAGLRAISAAAHAFPGYWQDEFVPALQSGRLPPLAQGVTAFLQAGEIAGAVQKAVEEELASRKRNPYDTHPPLSERIAALESLPAGEQPEDDPLAITLLEDVPAQERSWLAAVSSRETADKLTPIAWSEVGRAVYVPIWCKLVQANAANLVGITFGDLLAILPELGSQSRPLVRADGEPAHGDGHMLGQQVCMAALGLALLERGARMEAEPGCPILLHAGDEALDPWKLVSALAQGQVSPEEWRALCARHGIAQLLLSTGTVPAQPARPSSPSPNPRAQPMQLCRQGDVLIATTEEIPADAEQRSSLVLVQGEATGHAHRVETDAPAEVYARGSDLFLRVRGPFSIVHDEHAPIELPAGTYRVWQQREYDPVEDSR